MALTEVAGDTEEQCRFSSAPPVTSVRDAVSDLRCYSPPHGRGTSARRAPRPLARGEAALLGRAAARHAQPAALPAHGVGHPPGDGGGDLRAAAAARLPPRRPPLDR